MTTSTSPMSTPTPVNLKAQQMLNLEQSGFQRLGTLPVRQTTQIQGSRIGVGFETLDRYMFNSEQVYPYMHELGAKWARVQTGWSRCEPRKGVYEFTWLDEIVDRLLSAGVQPYFSVSFGNKLYMPDVPHESAVGFVPLYFGSETIAAWENYVRALAIHFKGRIVFWEIWNEPNIPQFWHPMKPSGTDYAKLVHITAAAILEKLPRAQIIGGAMSCLNPTFLEQALQAGMAQWIDIFSFHPYQPVPEQNLQNMHDLIRRLLDQYSKGKTIRIWQGENGCPSQTEGHNDDWFGLYDMDEMVQAKWIARRILVDLKIGFERAFYFHITDLMEQPYRQSGGEVKKPVMMGLLHGKVYRPKYSYSVFQRLCSLFDDQSERRELFYRFSELNVQKPQFSSLLSSPYGVSFVRNGHPLLAYWLAEDPQQKSSPREIDIVFWWDSTLTCDHPVLVDLLSGGVYDLRPHDTLHVHDAAIIGHKFRLPLTDYPLVIADASILNEAPSH